MTAFNFLRNVSVKLIVPNLFVFSRTLSCLRLLNHRHDGLFLIVSGSTPLMLRLDVSIDATTPLYPCNADSCHACPRHADSCTRSTAGPPVPVMAPWMLHSDLDCPRNLTGVFTDNYQGFIVGFSQDCDHQAVDQQLCEETC